MPDYAYPYIRPDLRQALDAYLTNHAPVGGFLESVIRGDWGGVISRADAQNQHFRVIRDFYWWHCNELRLEQVNYDVWIALGPK